jgi:hypothetical protein
MLSKIVDNLISKFYSDKVDLGGGEKIKVNNVISKAAFVYEKVRTAIDYNEDHLIRKNAVYRILKRKMLVEKRILDNAIFDKYKSDELATQLLHELILGKYLPNNVVPVSIINKVDAVLERYAQLTIKIKEVQGKIDSELFNFLLEMEAVEVEALFDQTEKEKAMVRAMFSVVNPYVILQEGGDEKEKEMQLFVGIHRILYKWDDAMINYLLLTLYYPEWKKADETLITELATNIHKIKREIIYQTNHPIRRRMLRILSKKAIIFLVMQDVLTENPDNAKEIFSQPEKLQIEVKKACEKRYKGVRVKLSRGVLRSIIYVFFTKMILALAIEFPTDIYLHGAVNYAIAGINIIFPPILMFLVAIMIRMPPKENTDQIVKSIKSIAVGDYADKKYILNAKKSGGKIMKLIFNLIYVTTFVTCILVLFWFLHKVGFNVFSSFIFVLFLTLVSFFGIRIRRPVKELLTIDMRESLIGSVVDFFSLPFISMGRILSEKFSKLNFIAFFMDFIIDAPFKLLIEIVEGLFTFLKEKKDDVMAE